MKILYLTISYPNVENNSNLYSDLANEFECNDHEIYVVAPSIDGETKLNHEGNTKVLRVKTLPLFKVSFIKKGIANILLPFQFNRAIRKYLSNNIFDVIISPTPPITLGGLIRKLKRKTGAKSYLILRDIFPQNAKDLGLIKSKVLFNYFRKKEKKLYKYSDFIGCMSKGNMEFILTHNKDVKKEKLHILPNWIKVKDYTKSSYNLKLKYGLDNRFIAVFGGNIGIPQYVDFIVDLAKLYVNNPEIIFLIIGDGTEKNRIKNRIRDENISNIVIKDRIPRNDYIDLIKQCDVGLVNLHPDFTIPNIPSRTMAYFQSKIPILAAVDRNTDYPKIIEDAKAGLWCYSDDLDSYKKCFEEIYNNGELRKSMGLNGLNYLKTNQDVSIAVNIILNKIIVV